MAGVQENKPYLIALLYLLKPKYKALIYIYTLELIDSENEDRIHVKITFHPSFQRFMRHFGRDSLCCKFDRKTYWYFSFLNISLHLRNFQTMCLCFVRIWYENLIKNDIINLAFLG